MSDYQGTPATPPILRPVWDAALARLRTYLAASYETLTDSGQVYRAGTDPWNGPQDEQWWRVALVPIVRAWPVDDQPGRALVTPFGVRSEVHVPDEDWDPMRMLEVTQREVFMALHGWKPAAGDLTDGAGGQLAYVRNPTVRSALPDPTPIRDDDRGVWTSMGEYTIVVESPDLAP